MPLGRTEEIASEGRKGLSQSRKDTQLWMGLVVKVKSDAVKNNIALKPGMLGQSGCDQTGDSKSEH